MNIERIDKNFASKKVKINNGKATYTLPHENFALYGVFHDAENNRFVRMPDAVATSVSEGVAYLATNTAGGRVCFQTDASFIELTATYPMLCNMRHMPLTGSSGFSLFENTPSGETFIGLLAPQADARHGFTDTLALKGDGMREYVLYFPLYNGVDTLTITLDATANVLPCHPYKDVLLILYYGSSITQGGCASRPDNSYQSIICKKNRIDYINLGFSGGARAEENMVEYLSKIPCSLFVCDYDHNTPTVEHLQNTHGKLYQRYRAANPDTPILFISKPDFKGTAEEQARHKIIQSTYETAKRQGDNNVYFLSGQTFFADGEVCDYTVDNCHPTDHGFAAMADKIYAVMQRIFQGENV